MRITFDNMSQVNTESAKTDRSLRTEQTSKTFSSYQVAFDGRDRVGFGVENTGSLKSKGQTQLPVQGTEADVQNMRNQLTIMSHTMSDEDFARLQKEGYDTSEMEPEEAVTILDKIKSQLLKAGVHVTGYTDDMDMDTLAAAVGSDALARSMVNAFAAQDIPTDRENVDKVVRALDMAAQLEKPGEGTYYYMAANEMSAVLKDFYMASASGSRVELEQSGQYFGEAIKGYITKNVSTTEGRSENTDLDMDAEIDKLLERLGVEAGEQEKNVAAWLIEKGLSVDGESIRRMKDIFAVEFPLEADRVIKVAAAAIADGVPVEEKNLTDATSNLDKAVAVYEKYHGEEALSLVQSRRQLEEVRLHMTVETNLKLLESGFSIDTAPIEETIEALKNVEKQLAEQYFPQAQNPQEKYQLYKETQKILDELPGLPATTMGSFAPRIKEGTLEQFYAEGKALESAYQKAGERYETLWTTPRADMGDSIQKAFANVDDILSDLGYEATGENRKVIRILGYNHMEMTERNLEAVKNAVETVEQVVSRMTPAATLKMIRDEVNPLESTLPKLKQYFEQQPEEYAQSSEKYSKFLYRLEQAGELTAREKEAFIGCYRLLHQLEKADGAAIGALVNTGAELNFGNILSAIRSGKFKGMDARVDDMLGALREETVVKLSISEQIQAGYKVAEASENGKEQAREFEEREKQLLQEEASMERAKLQEAAKAPTEVFAMLERGEIPATAQNVLAAMGLENSLGEVFNKAKREPAEIWQKLKEGAAFDEKYTDALREALQQVEEATVAEADTTMDVRQLQLFHKQLHIMRKLTDNQEYYFPMEIGGEITGIHLQIVEGEETKGLVSITLESERLGKISGTLQVFADEVTGYFVGNSEATVMNLRDSSDIVNNSLGEEWKSCKVEFIYSELEDIPMEWTRTSPETQVKSDSLYRLSKSFLQVLKAVGDARSEKYEN